MTIVPIIENLKNSSNKSLAVDGSSVHKVYSYSPGSGIVGLDSLNCILEDSGSASFGKFGSITALTNGLLISVTVSGVTTDITTIKDNADIVTRFTNCHFGNSASDTLGGAVGFGDSFDVFCGVLKFETPIILSDSDSIQITVRDNLTGINTLQISCIVRKDI